MIIEILKTWCKNRKGVYIYYIGGDIKYYNVIAENTTTL